VAYNCVVLIKQVPDTKRITGQAMNDDGTVNRSALPAIFNPEDLNALELALQIKDKFGGKITVITMGLPAAAAILRDSLFRGADDAILITDARCAASDTLATSYILRCAVKKIDYDIVLCGRQAIDGDTAQVGPQLAEKLGIPQITRVGAQVGEEWQHPQIAQVGPQVVEGLGMPQITSVDKPVEMNGKTITARRDIGNGWQLVKAKLPVLLTVTGDANEPRFAAAKKMMKYKNARTPIEVEQKIKAENPQADEATIKNLSEQQCTALQKKGLLIKQWDLDFIEADLSWCGRGGSPTKVHRIQSVVLAAKESKNVEPNDQGISDMIHELIEDKIIA
jgi:electron transfer flavoprotein beta subunit